MPTITTNITKNALRTNLDYVPTGAPGLGGTDINSWAFSDASNKNAVLLPWNPSYDADSDTNIEGIVNVAINLGASQSFIQPIAIHSPVRDIGKSGQTLYIDRKTRYVLTAIYRRQFIDGYMIIKPRVPYTGFDDEVRAFLKEYKTERSVLAGGDLFKLELSIIYLDIPSYD